MGYTAGQHTCITTLDRSIVVSAGAGSGKTFTLTKRIAHAFEESFITDIDQVLAITFTRKAASELKSRLKAELRAIGRVDQALKVDDAWVSTIHGMCTRMLRAHALEVGIDPGFEVVEGAKADELLQQAVDEVLDLMTNMRPSRALDELFSHYAVRSSRGMAGDSVESMVLRLVSLMGASPNGYSACAGLPDFPPPLDYLERAARVVEGMMPFAQAANDSKTKAAWLKSADEFAEQARALRTAYEQGAYEEASDSQLALAVLGVLAPMKFPRTFGTDFKREAPGADVAFRECLLSLRLIAARDDWSTLFGLAQYAYESYATLKHTKGVLDNNDLLTLAARMMEEHPDIAAQYADKFKLIMVDEFQDTDQMQVDMIKRLAGPGACRLCTVGDAQQSIYRFRGADVLVYQHHLSAVRAADDDAVIMLPDNFRSHRDVLSFVDCVFAQPSMFGGSFMSLAHSRDEGAVTRPYQGSGSRIEVQITTHPSQKGATTDEAVAVAARRIAARFAQLVREGHAASDMVILLGRMAKSNVYAQALREQGLACVITGGSVFAKSPEVALIKALLRVIANPHDTQALYEVLASPLFALTAGDFLRIATADGGEVERGRAYRRRALDAGVAALSSQLSEGEIEDASPQLVCAVRVLSGVRAAANRRTVARLLEQAVIDSGLVTRLEAQGAEGLASAGNVYKALRIIDNLEHDHACGPVQLVREFEATMESAKEGPGALSATGGDFVRIMTVHSSKGLEFPIVAVADIRTPRASVDSLLARHVDGQLVVSLDAGRQADDAGKSKFEQQHAVFTSLVGEGCDEDELLAIAGANRNPLVTRAALAEAECLGDAEEAKRLLYVALTRAKEALVVSIVGTMSNKEGSRFTSTDVLGGIVTGLDQSGQGFAPGVTLCDFGGTAPARVELVHLAEKGDGVAFAEASSGDAADETENEHLFAIPAPCEQVRVSRVNYRPARTDVFSYSSIAEAAHEGDVLSQLAQRFFCGADEAASDASLLGDVDWQQASDQVFWESHADAVLDEDDGSWAYTGESTADDDRATDLGTAFHRLAQYAVVARAEGSHELALPPAKRIDALTCACRLDGQQRQRLDDALERWFASDIAAQMAAYDDLRAEVPFFVALDDGAGSQVFLDGEIDLLACDGEGRAFVVDYKTGGHADETLEQLSEKHVLQASCYALSLLRQGIDEVQATFVRVEQPRANDPGMPQCVRYRFTAADLSILERVIAAVYKR